MIAALAAAASLLGSTAGAAAAPPDDCALELVVLGAGQDAGAPQIGNAQDAGPRLLPSSLALVDRENGARYLFDATPAITDQLAALDAVALPARGLGLDGIFLTHAHIGHYLGLAWLGREAAGAQGVPVYALPRMSEFLTTNGPWSQLVALGNIELRDLDPGEVTPVSDVFRVWTIPAPHRDEYSETAGFIIMTPGRRALYLPDIDSWDGLEESAGMSLETLLASVDIAFVDATFWDDGELPGRDMSAIPHPRVKRTMERLADLDSEQRGKLRFIHYNHTNPIRDPASGQSAQVKRGGFAVARRGQRTCLYDGGSSDD